MLTNRAETACKWVKRIDTNDQLTNWHERTDPENDQDVTQIG